MKRFLAILASTGLLTLFRMLSGFLIAKIVAIYTGPSGMALLGQMQGFVGILNGVITAPLGSGVVKYTAQYNAEGYEACAPWWEASLRWLIILLIIAIVSSFIFSQSLALLLFNNAGQFYLVCLAAILLPFSAASALLVSIYNGQQRYRKYITLNIGALLISTLIMSALVVIYGVNGMLLAATMFTAISGIVLLLASFKEPWFQRRFWWGNANITHLKGIGGYVAMSLTGALCLPASMIIVRSILISSLGLEQAGIWQAAYKISEVYLGVITIAIGTFYLPRLAILHEKKDVWKEILTFSKGLVPLIFLVFIFTAIFREYIIHLLFTTEFSAAQSLVIPQLVGDSAKILSGLFMYPLIAKGAVRVFVIGEIVFLLVIIVLSYCMIGYYGVRGASFAYAVNGVFYLFFSMIAYKRFNF